MVEHRLRRGIFKGNTIQLAMQMIRPSIAAFAYAELRSNAKCSDCPHGAIIVKAEIKVHNDTKIASMETVMRCDSKRERAKKVAKSESLLNPREKMKQIVAAYMT